MAMQHGHPAAANPSRASIGSRSERNSEREQIRRTGCGWAQQIETSAMALDIRLQMTRLRIPPTGVSAAGPARLSRGPRRGEPHAECVPASRQPVPGDAPLSSAVAPGAEEGLDRIGQGRGPLRQTRMPVRRHGGGGRSPSVRPSAAQHRRAPPCRRQSPPSRSEFLRTGRLEPLAGNVGRSTGILPGHRRQGRSRSPTPWRGPRSRLGRGPRQVPERGLSPDGLGTDLS
jgi:hypothetical protein